MTGEFYGCLSSHVRKLCRMVDVIAVPNALQPLFIYTIDILPPTPSEETAHETIIGIYVARLAMESKTEALEIVEGLLESARLLLEGDLNVNHFVPDTEFLLEMVKSDTLDIVDFDLSSFTMYFNIFYSKLRVGTIFRNFNQRNLPIIDPFIIVDCTLIYQVTGPKLMLYFTYFSFTY